MRLRLAIVFLGQEVYDKNGVSFTRYRYSVTVPGRPSPFTGWGLPRVNASHTGVTFVSKQKRPLGAFYGGRRNGLPTWFFELRSDVIPPSWVYLDVTTPPPVREYKSNLAETTL